MEALFGVCTSLKGYIVEEQRGAERAIGVILSRILSVTCQDFSSEQGRP